MKRLVVIALFLNAFLITGRLIQEANAGAGVPEPSRNGDVNCDGGLDLSDAVRILQFLFNGGPEPCAFAGDARLEDRVTTLERNLSDLQRSNRAHHTEIGTLSVADAVMSGLRIETDITARLSEIHAVATAGTDVMVEPDAALEFLNSAIESIDAIELVEPLDPRALRRPRSIARETDAALEALNAWVEAVDEAVVDTKRGYPQLFTAIVLAQSQGRGLGVATYLDAMVATNLEDLRAIVSGEEFRVVQEKVNALVSVWKERLQAGGDDAQLALLDLQDMHSKMQQVVSVLSAISKMLHDTAMAIIRNIR